MRSLTRSSGDVVHRFRRYSRRGLSLVALVASFVASGCSDRGHEHEGSGEHSEASPTEDLRVEQPDAPSTRNLVTTGTPSPTGWLADEGRQVVSPTTSGPRHLPDPILAGDDTRSKNLASHACVCDGSLQDIVVPPTTGTGENFGSRVAADTNWMVVGAPQDDTLGTDAGAAYVHYRHQGGTDAWGVVKKLTAPDAAAGDNFGYSVEIQGDWVVVGSKLGEVGTTDSGSIYIYERNTGGADNWGFSEEIGGRSANEDYGRDIALDQSTSTPTFLMVAVPYADVGNGPNAVDNGVVEIRRYDGTSWGAYTFFTGSGAGEDYGFSVHVDAPYMVVGGMDDTAGTDAGMVYIHEQNTGGTDAWGQVTTVAPTLAAGDQFGHHVFYSGGLMAVSAPGDDTVGSGGGAVYMYDSTWTLIKKLTASDGAAGDQFGEELLISGTELYVGAPNAATDGVVYEFSKDHGGTDFWGQNGRIAPVDVDGTAKNFGMSVGIDGGQLAVGAPAANSLDGAAYMITPGQCLEMCGDGVDNDCNGTVDDGCGGCTDADGDGFNDSACGGTDCDDSDATISPGAAEVCGDSVDNDCDGVVDEDCACADADGDGYQDAACGGTDCDDSDSTVHPGASDVCDGIDNNCDGVTDEGTTETCDGVDNDCDGAVDEGFDADADGYYVCSFDRDGDGVDEPADCDDSDGGTYPGATETCDGADNDCDGAVDEGFDVDGDGQTTCQGDCDDSDSTIYTGATEVCDGKDNDCDGTVDEGFDADGDGVTSCGGDCDDADSTVYPGATEVCDLKDNDCDGEIDEGFDSDGDGYTTCGGDCDDTDPAINPGAQESCDDQIDNNCNDDINEGCCGNNDCLNKCNGSTFCSKGCADYDATSDSCFTESCGTQNVPNCNKCANDCDDKDVCGSTSACTTSCNERDKSTGTCTASDCETAGAKSCLGCVDEDADGYDAFHPDYCPSGNDCYDLDAGINPGATEVCDGNDNDCDGLIDEGFDLDGDGYTTCGGDCNDNDAAINPGVTEACDGVDNNCDGTVDEGCGAGCVDNDADGYDTCSGDCNDADAAINPAATDVCDGVDNDCDGVTDEGTAEVCDGGDNDCDGQIDEDFDVDGDGHSTCAGDCDDSDAGVNPDATEVCDGVDNNCDGAVDEGFDADGDGQTTCDGDCDDTDATIYTGATEVCDFFDNDCDGQIDEGFDSDGDGYTTCDGDCDDADAGINPGATESCDGLDNDCDGGIDEGFDLDGDGQTTCDGDCDDSDASIYMGATEVCDGKDNDCDGTVDEGFDSDGDTYSACVDDCDDTDAGIHPGATEVCDGVDNDCDGAVDEDDVCINCTDGDGDGYPAYDATSCPSGDDCDDSDATVFPGAPELCDGKDNDCDGATDEDPDASGSCDDANACTTDTCSGGACASADTCSGADTECGCSTCQDCNLQDDWYDVGGLYACCDPSTGDACSACQDQEYRDYACGGTSCTYTVTNTQTLYGSCTSCDDGNICTDDTCSSGSCSNTNNTYSQPCYTGPAATEDVGVCTGGTETCSGGALSACEGEVTPTTEVCDGLDNDCDGTADDSPDVDPDCDDGDASTADACVGGTCQNTANCAGTDADCGSTTCEDCDLGDAWYDVGNPYACCDATDGACTCQDEEYRDYYCNGTACDYLVTAQTTTSSACTSCDDGNVCTDDTCSAGTCSNTDNSYSESCYTGPAGTEDVGECQGGTATCTGGVMGSCEGEVTPAVETCDALDNDCNGDVDDGDASLACDADQTCHWGTCYDDCAGTDCSTATTGSACYTDDFRCDDPTDPCAQITCPDMEICFGGACYDACTTDDECDPTFERCYQSSRCVDASDPCLDVQCPSDQFCYAGSCYYSCTTSDDCLDPTHACYDDRCATSACEGVDCPVGEVCFEGTCYQECTDDSQCSDPDEACYDNRCALSPCDGVQCADDSVCFEGTCYQNCEASVDCSDPSHICYEDRCQDPCDDTTCGAAETCYLGNCYQYCEEGVIDCTDPDHACYDNRCVDSEDPWCDGVECPMGEACYRGSCYDECADQSECDPDHVCYDDTCVPTNCGSTFCDDAEVCYNGICYQECQEDADCDDEDHICYDAMRCAASACEAQAQNVIDDYDASHLFHRHQRRLIATQRATPITWPRPYQDAGTGFDDWIDVADGNGVSSGNDDLYAEGAARVVIFHDDTDSNTYKLWLIQGSKAAGQGGTEGTYSIRVKSVDPDVIRMDDEDGEAFFESDKRGSWTHIQAHVTTGASETGGIAIGKFNAGAGNWKLEIHANFGGDIDRWEIMNGETGAPQAELSTTEPLVLKTSELPDSEEIQDRYGTTCTTDQPGVCKLGTITACVNWQLNCDQTVYPWAFEICDGVDNTCNGLTDATDPGLQFPIIETQQGTESWRPWPTIDEYTTVNDWLNYTPAGGDDRTGSTNPMRFDGVTPLQDPRKIYMAMHRNLASGELSMPILVGAQTDDEDAIDDVEDQEDVSMRLDPLTSTRMEEMYVCWYDDRQPGSTNDEILEDWDITAQTARWYWNIDENGDVMESDALAIRPVWLEAYTTDPIGFEVAHTSDLEDFERRWRRYTPATDDLGLNAGLSFRVRVAATDPESSYCISDSSTEDGCMVGTYLCTEAGIECSPPNDDNCAAYCGDLDEDGFINYDPVFCPTGQDCDDSDPETFPGADEYCNGRDNDCDGIVDFKTTDGCSDDAESCGPTDCGEAPTCRCPTGVELPGDPVDTCICSEGLSP